MTEPLTTAQRVLYFRGRDINELTRDELLVACRKIHEAYERERDWAKTVGEVGDALTDAALAIHRRR